MYLFTIEQYSAELPVMLTADRPQSFSAGSNISRFKNTQTIRGTRICDRGGEVKVEVFKNKGNLYIYVTMYVSPYQR